MTDPTCPHCCIPLSEHPADRCLDAWAAEKAGWQRVSLAGANMLLCPGHEAALPGLDKDWGWERGWTANGTRDFDVTQFFAGSSSRAVVAVACCVAPFSTDIAAAFQLEAEIAEAARQYSGPPDGNPAWQYISAMCKQYGIPTDGDGDVWASNEMVFEFAHASPETRTKAYIAAMTKEPEDGQV